MPGVSETLSDIMRRLYADSGMYVITDLGINVCCTNSSIGECMLSPLGITTTTEAGS